MKRSQSLWLTLLVIPTWVALTVELVGGWHYPLERRIHVGHLRDPLIWATVFVVVLSPLLLCIGVVIARRLTFASERKIARRALLTFLAISLLLSMASCVWSCGGHPTWTTGYTW